MLKSLEHICLNWQMYVKKSRKIPKSGVANLWPAGQMLPAWTFDMAASKFSLPKLEHNIAPKRKLSDKQTRRQWVKRSLSLAVMCFLSLTSWERWR